jgi:hypothetical protein
MNRRHLIRVLDVSAWILLWLILSVAVISVGAGLYLELAK